MARGLKFQIYEVERSYCLFSENKGADQLSSYCAADLRLVFAYATSRFSHDVTHKVPSLMITERFFGQFSIKTYIVGAPLNHLDIVRWILMGIHYISYHEGKLP